MSAHFICQLSEPFQLVFNSPLAIEMVKKTSALDGSGRGRQCSAADPKRGRVRGSLSGSGKRVWGAGGRDVVVGVADGGWACTSFHKHLSGSFKHGALCWETTRNMTLDLKEHPV